ncbi:MAG: thiamine pyrophosphate-binding protein [Chloroflexi bacterium]|nr:thiamine pyrophosphate-binding protein [Chloroflexota bacterium]
MANMLGKQAIMEILKKEGVEYLFGLPGTTELKFLDELSNHPDIKYILSMHEDVVVAMAEGYARASGKVAVANLHTAPGLAAAMATISNAQNGGVPLIITAGQQASNNLLQEPPLSGDLVGMVSPYVKWGTEPRFASDLPIAFRRAFKVAMTPPTGPVFISLPMDILDQPVEMNYSSSLPQPFKMRPDATVVNMVAEWLVKAQNPVILVGAGVERNGAVKEIVKLAELIGASVFHGWMTDVNFPTDHKLQLGDSRNAKGLVGAADILIGIADPPAGVELTPNAKLIQIDDDPWEIGKNNPVHAGILGDIKLSVLDLIASIKGKMTPEAQKVINNRIEQITGEKATVVAARNKRIQDEMASVPISFSRLVHELNIARPANSIIFDDCWSYSRDLADLMDYSNPLSFARTRGGAIGAGVANAIGMQIGCPDRKVIAVIGDGSTVWGNQALWTAAHYNIPVTFVICSNACYRILNRTKVLFLGPQAKNKELPGLKFDVPRIDFCKMAESMGVKAEKVVQPDALGGALKSAIASKGPSLIEVYLDEKT